MSHTHYLNSSCPLCCTMKQCLHPLLEHTWVNCGTCLDVHHLLFGSTRRRNESKLNDSTQNEILRGTRGDWLWPEHLSNLDLYIMSFFSAAEQGKAFVLLCPIHLYLLKSFTVFHSFISLSVWLLGTQMYHPSLLFPPSLLNSFTATNSLYSRSLYLLVLRPKSSLICRMLL